MVIKYADIVTYVKAQRIKWIGHVVIMDQQRRVKGISDWRPVELSRNGRERLRWEGDVIVDLGKIKIQNWRKICMDRDLLSRPKLIKSCSINTREI